MIALKQNLASQYEAAWQHYFNNKADDCLSALRRKQFDLFLKKGLPTIHEEEWKYTNLTPLDQHQFEFFTSKDNCLVQSVTLPSLACDHYRLVFVDGCFHADLSILPKTEIIITNLSNAISKHTNQLQEYIEQKNHSAFSLLNTACAEDGTFIYIKPDTKVLKPIHMLFMNNHDTKTILQTIRNIIIIDQNAEATIYEEHYSLNHNPYFANVCTQIYAKENSHVEYIKLQRQHAKSFHIANCEIHQQRNSQVNAHHFHLGSEIAREDINGYLNEPNASLHLHGLYQPLNKQHIDIHTFIHHLADHTESNELYKGVIASKSRAVFNGNIFVAKNIKKAAANLQNKNLLLARDAEVNTKPELEIHSDDVKCKHGATIGQIDKEMLFYLRSRGLSKEHANQLLLLAFVRENLNAIIHQAISKTILDVVTNYCEEVIR